MKRFFTKKSVVLILATILLFGFFNVNTAHAAWGLDWIGKTIGDAAVNVAGGVIGIATTIVAGLIEFIAIPLASIYLAIAGNILDFSVQYTMYGEGFTTMTAVIQSVWTLIRDTANITFIFILLYAAIQQIITSTTKKDILVSVIISAVLINFSLFTTKIIIDANNLVATALYNQITLTTNTSNNATKNLITKITNTFGGTSSQIDLSGRIMDGLGLTTMFDVKGAGNDTEISSIVGIGGLINSVFRLVLFIITSYVFMLLAAVLIGRFAMLIFLMITSPIGFVGKVVPGLGEASKHWWKNLFDQALIAPILMFFMLLTIKLSQVIATQPTTNPIILIFNFYLIVFLLIKAVSIVKNLSGPIGSMADKIASVAGGLALGATTGGTALLARQTIGRGANALANSTVGKRLEAYGREKGFGSGVVKTISGGIKGTASSTFDVRSTATGKAGVGQLGGMVDKRFAQAGGTYGKGQTGYAGMQASIADKALKEAKEGEKSAKEYEQKVVDTTLTPQLKEVYEKEKEKEISELKNQQTNLNKEKGGLDTQKTELEKELKRTTDVVREKEIKEKIEQINKQTTEITNKTTETGEKIKSTTAAKESPKTGDIAGMFSAAEAKIAAFNKMEKDFAGKTLNDEEKKLIEKVEKEADEAGEFLQKNQIPKNLTKKIETIKRLKKVRENMANNFRKTSMLNTLQRSENREIAAKIMRDKPKEKTEREKELEAIGKAEAAERIRLEKESGTSQDKKEEALKTK
ncbi:MAG: hypothetical protein ABIF22_00460 [bacterium]